MACAVECFIASGVLGPTCFITCSPWRSDCGLISAPRSPFAAPVMATLKSNQAEGKGLSPFSGFIVRFLSQRHAVPFVLTRLTFLLRPPVEVRGGGLSGNVAQYAFRHQPDLDVPVA